MVLHFLAHLDVVSLYWFYQMTQGTRIYEELAQLGIPHRAMCLNFQGYLLKGRFVHHNSRRNASVPLKVYCPSHLDLRVPNYSYIHEHLSITGLHLSWWSLAGHSSQLGLLSMVSERFGKLESHVRTLQYCPSEELGAFITSVFFFMPQTNA